MDKPWMQYYDDGIESKISSFDGTLYDQLSTVAKAHPSGVAFTYYTYSLTYSEFITAIDRTADNLRAYGFKKGDVLLTALPNCPQFLYLLYGANKLGVIVCALDYRVVPAFIRMTMEDFTVKGIAIMDTIQSRTDDILRDLPTDFAVICNTTDYLDFISVLNLRMAKRFPRSSGNSVLPVMTGKTIVNWSDFVRKSPEDRVPLELEHPTRDDDALYMSLGSATGEFMIEAYKNSAFTSAVGPVMLGYDIKDPFESGFSKTHKKAMTPIPNSYSVTMAIALHSMLCCGIEVILVPYYYPKSIAYLLYTCQPNILIGHPTMFSDFVDFVRNSGRYNRKSLVFLEKVISMTSAMTLIQKTKLNRFLYEHNSEAEVQEGYGLSECLGISTLNPSGRSRTGSVGIPLPGILMKIVDRDSQMELMPGQQGEICINSRSVISKVVIDDKMTEKVLRKHRDGRYWVHTGDIGHMDDDGFFYFDYSLKRCAKVEGMSVSLKTVEDAIKKIDGVEDVCVVNYVEPDGVNRLIAVVVPYERYLFDNDELISLKNRLDVECSMMLLREMRPSEIEYRASLPKTDSGIDFNKVLEEIIENRKA